MSSSTKKLVSVWVFSLAAVLGASVWYLCAPGTPPEGQPPLADLSVDRSGFETAFNAQPDVARIVAVLSPTRRERLEDASALQQILSEFRDAPVAVHVIWQPEAESDRWAAPATETMARVWDGRARQYWDPAGAVGRSMGEERILVFAPGTVWRGGPPTAVIGVSSTQQAMSRLRAYVRSITPSRTGHPGADGIGLLSI